ncbi:amino acid permease [Yinghuangia soli]|uniref:Amino acid permease n=1 Tax=Yinghuangia soli TaxID=2908204 RepID=A0AA41PUW0_9ACTN|nr:amino acid permease [Yinghuangia soli]MCF2526294.1 amino acid permease [Yinghuangia soli]
MTTSSPFRTKTVEQSIRDTEDPEHGLKRALSALDLTVFGVGVIIGTGIFVLTGTVARDTAGPAVALSFVVSGIVCALAALCYAEFASTVPVAGSAYTFAYTSIGELPAWIIGWDLILELALGAAVVAVGWSGYVQSLLASADITLPNAINGGTDDDWGFNLPAALLVLLLTLILVYGVKLSSRFTAVIVFIKVAVVLIVIFAGLFFIKGSNYSPFIPPKQNPGGEDDGLKQPLIEWMSGFEPSSFGVMGIFFGAATVFFAYIGFDIVASAAEETKKPQRDLPIGILGSLAICTVLYVAVSIVVTGMQKYTELSISAPLSDAFKAVGHGGWAWVINVGAVAGLTSVTMIMLLGQSRVFFAMSRDGLIPRFFSETHPTYRTPYRSTIALGFVVAFVAGIIPLKELAELVNIGTLFAFVVVSIGVIVLRRTRPDLPRSFRTPWVPYLPIASVLACLWLMINLPVETWWRFLVWMALGFVIYFLYSRKRSRLSIVETDLPGISPVVNEQLPPLPGDRDDKN